MGSKVIAEMQMFHKRNLRSSWTLPEKNFAINLYYKSPATYKFLRNNQQIILPGETTLRRWIGKSKFCPGFNSFWLKQIKIKLDTMSDDEKYCVIIFDEMKIKSFLEYSKYLDMVEGFEDLGHRGRTNKLATQAMVSMVRGLYNNWKLPLAYFLSGSSMSSLISKDLITDNALSISYTDTETLVESVSDSFIYSEEEGTFDQCLSNNEETITLETCSNAYFAGYLAKKFLYFIYNLAFKADCSFVRDVSVQRYYR
ncbi:hypothetical protein QTP88_007806 [Uroleucon formosanum]